jgi:ubiquinone/menaquinone biosynthesis C-methylase UbiE
VRAAKLPPAALAFDQIADGFDGRFQPWLSVSAQRRAIRQAMAEAFPQGSRLLEIGGGTGDDALWNADRGCDVLLTDASPAMVRVARGKFVGRLGVRADVAPAEAFETFADHRCAQDDAHYDGAYSVFAPLNCVTDLKPFARGLARLLRPGAPALLVVFGRFCLGEMIIEAARRRPGNMFRRFARGDVPARLSGRAFTVRYHSKDDMVRAMAPWFELQARRGVGVFVPPSAAEPWISHHPELLRRLERLDRALAGPLTMFGDHILYRFKRVHAEAA